MKLNNQISKELRSELKLLRRQNSKLKHKEEELTQQAAFQKNNPAPLIRTRYDGTILNVNPAGIEIFGKRVIGSSVFSILTNLKRSHLKKITRSKTFRMDISVNNKEFQFSIRKDTRTKSFYIFGSNITSRKLAEEDLRVSEEKYRTLVEDSPLLICKLDTKGIFTYLNRAWEKTVGYTNDEMIGHSFTEFKKPEEATRTYNTSRNVVKGTSLRDYETTYIAKNGSEILLNFRAGPTYDLARNVVGMQAMAEDITERKQAEEALKESEKKLRDAEVLGSIGNWEFDIDDGSITWSENVYRLYDRDRNLGPPTSEEESIYYSPEEMRRMQKFARLAIDEGKEFEYDLEAKLPGGKISYFHVTMSPIRDEKGRVIKLFGTVQDITERKQAEQALTESEERYKEIVEGTENLVTQVDREGNFLFVNEAAEKILGIKKEECIGLSAFDFIHPNDREKTIDKFKSWINSDSPRITFENRLVSKTGELFTMLWTINKKLDDHGNIISINSIARDITNQKQLEKQLQEAQRLETVGQLAGGVAHDFNNALAAIVGYAELSLGGVEKNSQVMKDLQALIDRANKSAALVKKLLAFSRNQVMIIKPVDINQIIEETISFIKPILGEDIKLVRKLDHGIPEIQADPTAVDQIITNLCINARDAMQNGGKITIGTKLVTVEEEYSNSHVEASIGNYVVLSILDDGTGMDEETLSRIYEPFFTTKEVGKGSGLGLSMVYGLMKQHGGFIECDSKLGMGTEFKIYFEVTKSAIKQEELVLSEEPIVLGGNETILLVEDDVDVLHIMKRGLEGRGYTVFTAENGRDALEIYKKNRDQIDIVVSDVVLPKMSGIDFYNSVREIDPDARFLFISGYAEGILKQKFNIEKDIQLLKKPFNIQKMVVRIRDILDV